MSSVNLNVRVDKEVKEKAQGIFEELGINMTTAVNMFLRQCINRRTIPFELIAVTDENKGKKQGG